MFAPSGGQSRLAPAANWALRRPLSRLPGRQWRALLYMLQHLSDWISAFVARASCKKRISRCGLTAWEARPSRGESGERPSIGPAARVRGLLQRPRSHGLVDVPPGFGMTGSSTPSLPFCHIQAVLSHARRLSLLQWAGQESNRDVPTIANQLIYRACGQFTDEDNSVPSAGRGALYRAASAPSWRSWRS
ncbi:uncharacterized protein BDZ99DRAFT_522926 [Mytilinidion resinicola]|uniref:Uncharacterized protein n=1 Tax=Mytilinidion resinicola TaxID=574789 RepID=A0A6A6YEZ8_9PEZI|nr:uncharacterized protein BDZ99DRAFT_522926 [Mytilinidion resinicola]KAF2807310.1 hypothetical protein BDZ99DRAFT_522926 [Mytilinidion resinicola]